ncbi:type II secretion system F family protein [Streptomyces sp. AA1529]|uniref:type II secretion system F family protein n=1 Tax=Streptomyces sp. AA1529 TaxID=1203257 RepID=UPI00055B07FC|nr:type II secretion system F family protein [Streptomyces sp. AA1529]
MSVLPMDATMGVLTAGLGATFGAGAVAMARGVKPRPEAEDDTAGKAGGWRWAARQIPPGWRSRRRMALAVFGGAVTGALTGWPVAGVLTVIGAITLPGLLGPDVQARGRTERLEALATWTEMLRDTLSAAAGMEQTILATCDIPPAALEKELHALAAAVREGRPLPEALEGFAHQVDDPVADVVVTSLVMAARKQASQLAALLGELADSVREQVAMRQRVEAGRASIRTGVRVTVTVTVGMAVGLTVFNRPYLDPFNTLSGQVVLATVGALFALSFTWMSVISRIEEPVRLLTPSHAGATTGGAQ